jgi:iron(III) transport system substrate-binding protein
MSRRVGCRLLPLILAAVLGSTAAPAQAPQADAAAVYLDRGAERDQRLVEKAKQEGTLTLYTSMATTESNRLKDAFEKKYGVKVQIWRALSENVLQRTVTEARARRHSVDVIETNGPEVDALGREQLISEFYSPYLADLPGWAIPPHRLYVSDRANLFVVAFNTNKVKREEIPASYEGFADPKWKGKLAIEATDEEWMGAIVTYWGEERGMKFFRSLAALKPDVRKGHVLLAQLVAAGEVPVGLTVYSGNADSVKEKGGPIDWAPVEPLVGRPQGLALAKNAPHPYAALLFADFVLSPEGQKLLNEMGRVPSSRTQKTVLDTAKYTMIDATRANEDMPKWQKIWKELFLQ